MTGTEQQWVMVVFLLVGGRGRERGWEVGGGGEDKGVGGGGGEGVGLPVMMERRTTMHTHVYV